MNNSISKQFFNVDDGTGGTGGTGGANDVTTFEFTDPQNGSKHNLPVDVGGVNIQEMIGHVIGKSRTEAKKALEKEYQDKYSPILSEVEKLKGTNSELDEKLRVFEEEKLSVEERAKAQADRQIKKFQDETLAAVTASEKNWGLFANNLVETEILKAFSGFDLTNQNQAMILLKQSGQPKVVDTEGVYSVAMHMLKEDEVVEVSVKDAVASWLAQSENMHFLKNNLIPGSGSGGSNTGKLNTDGATEYTREQLCDPKIRKEYLEKVEAGESVQIKKT